MQMSIREIQVPLYSYTWKEEEEEKGGCIHKEANDNNDDDDDDDDDDVSSISSSSYSSSSSLSMPSVDAPTTRIVVKQRSHMEYKSMSKQLTHDMNSGKRQGSSSSRVNYYSTIPQQPNISVDNTLLATTTNTTTTVIHRPTISSSSKQDFDFNLLKMECTTNNNEKTTSSLDVCIIDMDSLYRIIRIEKKRLVKRQIENKFHFRMRIHPENEEEEKQTNNAMMIRPRIIVQSNPKYLYDSDCPSSCSATNNTSVVNLASNSILLNEERSSDSSSSSNCSTWIQEILHPEKPYPTTFDSQMDFFLLPNHLDPSKMDKAITRHDSDHKRIVSNPTDTTAPSSSSSISIDDDNVVVVVGVAAVHTPCRSSSSSSSHNSICREYHTSSSFFEDPLSYHSKFFYSSSMDKKCILSTTSSPLSPPPPQFTTTTKYSTSIHRLIPSLDTPFDESTPCSESNKVNVLHLIQSSSSCLENNNLDHEKSKKEEDSSHAPIGEGGGGFKKNDKQLSTSQSLTRLQTYPHLDASVMQVKTVESKLDQDELSLSNYQQLQLQQEFVEKNDINSSLPSHNTTLIFLGTVKNNDDRYYCPFDEQDEIRTSIFSCGTDVNIGTISVKEENDVKDDATTALWNEKNPIDDRTLSKNEIQHVSSIIPELSHLFETNDKSCVSTIVKDSVSAKEYRTCTHSTSSVLSPEPFTNVHSMNDFLDNTSKTYNYWDDFNQEAQSSLWLNQDPFSDYKPDTKESLHFEGLESKMMDAHGFPLLSGQKIVLPFPAEIKNTPLKSGKILKKRNTSTTRVSVINLNPQFKKTQKPESTVPLTQENVKTSRTSNSSSSFHKAYQSESNQTPIQYIYMTEDGLITSNTKASKTTRKDPSGSQLLTSAKLCNGKTRTCKDNNVAKSIFHRLPWTSLAFINHTSLQDVNQTVSLMDSHPLLIDANIEKFGSVEGTQIKDLEMTNKWRHLFRRNGTNLSLDKLYQGKNLPGVFSLFKKNTNKQLSFSTQPSLAATTLDNSGKLLYQKGDYVRAVTMFEEALRIKLRVYGSNEYLDIAESKNNIGCARVALATPQKALSIYLEALGILKEIVNRFEFLDPDILQYQAMTLRNIGHTLFALKKFDFAASCYQEACTLFKMSQGDNQASCMETLDSCVLAKRAAMRDTDASSLTIRIAQYSMWSKPG